MTRHTLLLGVHTLHVDGREMQQIHDLGASDVVQVFSWREIEPSQGQFHWEYTDWLVRAAEYYHLNMIARLDKPPAWAVAYNGPYSAPPDHLSDYANFVASVAKRYRGRIAAYIIWNEPNLAREWGNRPPDPAAYAALLKTVSTSLRQADPAARVVAAGLAPTIEHSPNAQDDLDFLRALYANGARDAFDILAAHPYAATLPPDDPRGAHDGLNFWRIADLHDIMAANGDANKPIWITEFGYTTDTPPDSANLRVSEADQARYIPQAYELARQQMPYVGLFTVWNLTNEVPASDEQAGYSLTRTDGSPKPAYASIQAMQKETPAANIAASVTAQSDFTALARDAVVHLGDSEYPTPWVPLYNTRNPSAEWSDQVYLNPVDLNGRTKPWLLTMELMQVNDFDTRVLVNDQPVDPPYPPTEDFTSIWVTAQFQVPAALLRPGPNTIALRDGKLYPAFQQLGYTWDDFQVRNVVLHAPK